MAFQNDLSNSLAASGVTLDAAAAPDQNTLIRGLQKLNAFMESLDNDTASVLNEIAAEFPIKALLAEPTVNIAPELRSVLKAFDQANVPFSIADMARLCQTAADAPPRPSDPGTPNINAIEPHQFTLRNQANIVVRWTNRDVADKYHFMWTDRIPVPVSAADWHEVELNTNGTFGFGFLIPDTFVGVTYTFKVQACKTFDLGPDLCSAFCSDRAFVMPKNTHSLRQFFAISGVPPNAGVRSLGAPEFSAGLRAMMRL